MLFRIVDVNYVVILQLAPVDSHQRKNRRLLFRSQILPKGKIGFIVLFDLYIVVMLIFFDRDGSGHIGFLIHGNISGHILLLCFRIVGTGL